MILDSEYFHSHEDARPALERLKQLARRKGDNFVSFSITRQEEEGWITHHISVGDKEPTAPYYNGALAAIRMQLEKEEYAQ